MFYNNCSLKYNKELYYKQREGKTACLCVCDVTSLTLCTVYNVYVCKLFNQGKKTECDNAHGCLMISVRLLTFRCLSNY